MYVINIYCSILYTLIWVWTLLDLELDSIIKQIKKGSIPSFFRLGPMDNWVIGGPLTSLLGISLC